MGRRLLVAVLPVVLVAGGFMIGRASVHRPRTPSATGSVAAGRDAAFSGFDGGWALATPYIVTLRHGGPGITYRFARRWTMFPDTEYRICGRGICSRRVR